MATVAELSEPYRNHLIPVLPPDWGVCGVCRTAAHPDFRLCFQCNTARNEFRQGLADAVVPIALAVKREQLAHELWHYKYDVDPSVRAQLAMRLGAVLWRFLGQHEKHIAEAAGVPEFCTVTTVPWTRKRDGQHPLERIVGTLVGQTRDRYEPLLTLGQGGAPSHTLAADRYRATRALRDEPAVLLIDDTTPRMYRLTRPAGSLDSARKLATGATRSWSPTIARKARPSTSTAGRRSSPETTHRRTRAPVTHGRPSGFGCTTSTCLYYLTFMMAVVHFYCLHCQPWWCPDA